MIHTARFLLSVWLLLPLGLRAQPLNSPLSDWMQGSTNHFGGPQEDDIDPFNPLVYIGGCSYGEMDPRLFPYYNIMSVAPDSNLAFGKTMNGCGACYEIQCADTMDRCNNGPFTNSVIAMIGGTCLGGCSNTQINLHVFAFDRLAPIRLGNIAIRLRQVECIPDGNIAIRVKVYRVDAGGYIKFVVRNIPGDGGLRSAEIKGSREVGTWRPAENLFGAAWEASILPSAPLDLRLTNTRGEQLVLKEIIPFQIPGFVGEVVSNVQFSRAAKTLPNPAPMSPATSLPLTAFPINTLPFPSQQPQSPSGSPFAFPAAETQPPSFGGSVSLSEGTVPTVPDGQISFPGVSANGPQTVLQFPQNATAPSQSQQRVVIGP